MAEEPAKNGEQEAVGNEVDRDKEAEEETSKGRVNLIVGIIIVVMIAVIGAGVFFSFRFVESERQRALNEWQIRLGIVADSRVADINEWMELNFDSIAELTENASLQLYMSELSDANNDKTGVTDATAQQGYLRNLLVAVADRNGFAPPAPQQETNSNVERAGTAGMALLDSDGKPIVLTPEMPPLSGKQRSAIGKSFDGEPAVIDMYKGTTNHLSNVSAYGVRHQSFWPRLSFDIMESLAHLVCYIKRRICDDASAWFQLSFV